MLAWQNYTNWTHVLELSIHFLRLGPTCQNLRQAQAVIKDFLEQWPLTTAVVFCFSFPAFFFCQFLAQSLLSL